MPIYHVHVYREMKLYFRYIEADTPAAAALIAAEGNSVDAEDCLDCEGETFSALVDVDGDEEYADSTMIDFDAERLRKAAPDLLEALDNLLEQTVDQDLKHGISLTEGEEEARAKALAAIAKARAA